MTIRMTGSKNGKEKTGSGVGSESGAGSDTGTIRHGNAGGVKKGT